MIDRETVDRIIDTADIVDVVSDFVSLRRRGANFIGLCPFHDEKTPSFSVSPSKQICHCFGCGKGGSSVNFIMEHEQMSYVEALRYLAKKYNIEIHEKELTDEEKSAQTERESMLVVNEFAAQFFESQLFDTQEGKNIGLSYFYERGFNDATIKKFHLGYSPINSKALYNEALAKGFNRKFLIATGLCIDDNRGGGFDRFHGRVMFPVMNIAGKIIAFGGRTLKKTKEVAKYFNSPESAVYVKNRELYGLFQAKRAIVKEEKCFLVEGYTDVISMHQAGIENVVASSGTSLTEGQIRAIHRFTENVTVLYDGDSAGIHASLRGIDMLLAEGLNIKVLLLPEGEDPDSFARTHSASEFKDFIAQNETDFISFKIKTLLEGTQGDPIKRTAVIGDVIKSIAHIPNAIARSIYAKESSIQFDIAEDVILREVAKCITQNKEEEFKRKQREKNRAERQQQLNNEQTNATTVPTGEQTPTPATTPPANDAAAQQVTVTTPPPVAPINTNNSILFKCETDLIGNIVKYGMCHLCFTEGDNEQIKNATVLEFVSSELSMDNITFSTPRYKETFDVSLSLINDFNIALQQKQTQVQENISQQFKRSLKTIDTNGLNVKEIEKKEKELMDGFQKEASNMINEFRRYFLEKKLCSHINNNVRSTANEMISEKHQLSRIYANENREPLEDKLYNIISESLYNLKNAIITCEIVELRKKLNNAAPQEIEGLLTQLNDLYQLRKVIAPLIGERVVNPRLQ